MSGVTPTRFSRWPRSSRSNFCFITNKAGCFQPAFFVFYIFGTENGADPVRDGLWWRCRAAVAMLEFDLKDDELVHLAFKSFYLPRLKGPGLGGDVDADLDAGSVRLIRYEIALVVNLF